MKMEISAEKQKHKISLERRRHLEICGVVEVVSFDDISVTLVTDCGEMNVEGRELKIGVLDTEQGIVVLDGTLDAIYYSEPKESKRARLFKR